MEERARANSWQTKSGQTPPSGGGADERRRGGTEHSSANVQPAVS